MQINDTSKDVNANNGVQKSEILIGVPRAYQEYMKKKMLERQERQPPSPQEQK